MSWTTHIYLSLYPTHRSNIIIPVKDNNTEQLHYRLPFSPYSESINRPRHFLLPFNHVKINFVDSSCPDWKYSYACKYNSRYICQNYTPTTALGLMIYDIRRLTWPSLLHWRESTWSVFQPNWIPLQIASRGFGPHALLSMLWDVDTRNAGVLIPDSNDGARDIPIRHRWMAWDMKSANYCSLSVCIWKGRTDGRTGSESTWRFRRFERMHTKDKGWN